MEMDDGWLYDINGFDVRIEVAKEMEDAYYNLSMDMGMYANDEHPDPDWEPPSGGYGCMGCDECYAREHLFVQTGLIARAVLAGTIRLTRIEEIAPGVDTSGIVPLIAGEGPDHPASENDDDSPARTDPDLTAHGGFGAFTVISGGGGAGPYDYIGGGGGAHPLPPSDTSVAGNVHPLPPSDTPVADHVHTFVRSAIVDRVEGARCIYPDCDYRFDFR